MLLNLAEPDCAQSWCCPQSWKFFEGGHMMSVGVQDAGLPSFAGSVSAGQKRAGSQSGEQVVLQPARSHVMVSDRV